jgi:hypothetical protein
VKFFFSYLSHKGQIARHFSYGLRPPMNFHFQTDKCKQGVARALMEATQTKAANGLALVSAPWPLYDRPSIQFGALSAWIKGALPDCPVDAHYASLNVANCTLR